MFGGEIVEALGAGITSREHIVAWAVVPCMVKAAMPGPSPYGGKACGIVVFGGFVRLFLGVLDFSRYLIHEFFKLFGS